MRRNKCALAFLLALIVFSAFGTPLNPKVKADSGAPPSARGNQLWNLALNKSTVKSPVVSGGFVYVECQPSFSSPTILYCINAATGSQVWKITDNFGSFTVANGYVYVGATILSGPFYSQGVVYCLDASDGSEIWTKNVTGYVTAPVIVGNAIYVSTNWHNPSTDTTSGFVYALDSVTGADLWSYEGPASTSFGTPVVVDGSVYVVSSFLAGNSVGDFTGAYSGVYVLQASTGQELWNYTMQGSFISLVVDGANVYVSCDYYDVAKAANLIADYDACGILAFNAQNGQLIWSDKFSHVVSSFTFAGSTVYLVSGSGFVNGQGNVASRNGFVYALDSSNGNVLWNYTSGQSLGSSLFVSGNLCVGTSGGVCCFNANNGAVIWNFTTTNFSDSSATNPTYANGIVYVGWNGPMFFSSVTQHDFYALDASNGKGLWSYPLPYTIMSSPTAADGTVYVGASFVTSLSPDNEKGGALLALSQNVSVITNVNGCADSYANFILAQKEPPQALMSTPV